MAAATAMTKSDFNAWLAVMGWDRHGGRSEAAKALGVSTETVRKLAGGESPSRSIYAQMLLLRMKRDHEKRRETEARSLEMMLDGSLKVRHNRRDITADSIIQTRDSIDLHDWAIEAIEGKLRDWRHKV